MRLVSLLFVFLFLSACSVYTVTNKTDQNLQLKIAGGETRDLKAGACMELTEYFIGLGGDFPFGIDGYEREFNPNNYEIIKIAVSNVSPTVNPGTSVATTTNSNGSGTKSTVDSNTETGTTVNLEKGYKIVNSDKNLTCDPDESDGEDVSLEPLCEDGKKVICDGSKAQCKKGVTTPVCVDNNNQELTEVKPICVDRSKKAVCKEAVNTAATSDLKIDNSAKAICVSGTSRCESGTLGCAEIKGRLTPVCIGSDGKSSGKVLCSEMQIPKAICIKTVKKVEQASVAVSCNQGAAQCDAARPVCGHIPEDAKVKPYCVNSENIRWPVNVTCPDNTTPTCS